MLTDTEIDTLKQRIKELEDACVHYKAREEQMIDMLQRIGTIVDEEDDEYAM